MSWQEIANKAQDIERLTEGFVPPWDDDDDTLIELGLADEPERPLTFDEEKFVQLTFAGLAPYEAYKKGYFKHSKDLTNLECSKRGEEVLKRPAVQVRMAEISLKARELTLTSITTLDYMFKAAFDEARIQGQAAAMVSATRGLAQLHGLNQPQQIILSTGDDVPDENEYMSKMRQALLERNRESA